MTQCGRSVHELARWTCSPLF